MLAFVRAVLLMTVLLAAVLVAALLTAALPVLAVLPVATLALLAAMALVALIALVALVAGVLALHVVALHPGVRAALRIRTAGGIERCGQALAHVLHVDVGDGQFTTAHARPLAVIHRAQHAIIMVGMLQEILGGNPIAGRSRIACELQIFFQDLVGIAANPQLLPPALVSLTLVVAAATHSVWLARTASASASIIVIVLFHVERHFAVDCDRDGRSSRMSASLRVLQYPGATRCRSPRRWTQSMCGGAVLGLASLCDGRLSPGLGPWSAPTAGMDPSRFGAAFQ